MLVRLALDLEESVGVPKKPVIPNITLIHTKADCPVWKFSKTILDVLYGDFCRCQRYVMNV